MSWISVGERLPEVDGHFAFSESAPVLGVIVVQDGPIGPRRVRVVYFVAPTEDESGYWVLLHSDSTRVDVTHWMPLPELP